MLNLLRRRGKVLISVLVFLWFAVTVSASVLELDAIGKIESIYRDRVTMRIIKLVGSDTERLPVSVGSWVSFDLPKHPGKSRNRRNEVSYGSIVKAELVGNIATEYEVSDTGTSMEEEETGAPVLLWMAQSVVRVKNPDQYLTEEERQAKRGRRRRGRKKEKEKKSEEPVKVWTQEETVRGIVNLREKEKRLYIKEARMGRRDKGLDVVDDEWYEKLKGFNGQKVVIHGTTNRTSLSSGTVEIQNILKIYPK